MKSRPVIIFTVIFAVLSISLIVYRCDTRPGVVAESTGFSDGTDKTVDTTDISVLNKGMGPKNISIPLPENILSENVNVYSDYVRQMLIVTVQESDAGFYRGKEVECSGVNIKSAQCFYSNSKEQQYLCFTMEDVYEYTIDRSVKDKLIINIQKPEDTYDKIVVIDVDPSENGNEIRSLISEKLSQYNVKAYFTTNGTNTLEDSEIVELVESVSADLFIKIGFGSTAKPGIIDENIVTFYNENFFSPEYTNVSFAERLERDCVYAFKGKKAIVKPDASTGILDELEIPAAEVKFSNEIMGENDSEDNVSQGITNCILYSYEDMEKENNT